MVEVSLFFYEFYVLASEQHNITTTYARNLRV